MSNENVVKRTKVFSVKLEDVADFLDFKLETDPYDDVYHGGYSKADLKNIALPGKFEGIEKYLPNEVCVALEDAERDAIASALYKATLEAIESSLESIAVPGEYIGINELGEEVSVSMPSCITSAVIDGEMIDIAIENPEHLINDLINGEGGFFPQEILVGAAQDEKIMSHIHYLGKYFDIYGYSKHRIDDRIESYADDELIEHHLSFRICEVMEEDAAIEAIMDHDEPKEAAVAICKLTGWDVDQILSDAKTRLQEINKELLKKFD